MSFIINQNFDLKSPQFNFARDYYETLDALKTACGGDWGGKDTEYSSFPDHFITSVGGTLYQYTKANTVDTKTGKWRKLEFGVTNEAFQEALNTVKDKALAAEEKAEAAGTQASKNAEDIQILNGNLANKVDKVNGKGLSTNDYTTAEKTKLAGIAEGANKTIVDATWKTNSTNPVESKLIKQELDKKLSKTELQTLSDDDIDALWNGATA